MAITPGFRPTQHVYQSTYQPFPWDKVGAIAMQMQQEHMLGARKIDAVNEIADGFSSTSIDKATAEEELSKVREQVKQVAQNNPEFRGPEFEMQINKTARDLKNNKTLQMIQANAAMEQKYKEIANSEGSAANKFAAMQPYMEYVQSGGTKGYGLLPEPVVPEYTDYRKQIEATVDNIEKSMIGDAYGVQPIRVANALGLGLNKKGQLDPNEVQLSTDFLQSDGGQQLLRDSAFLLNDLQRTYEEGEVVEGINKPIEDVTLNDVAKLTYFNTTAPMVDIFSGYKAATDTEEDMNTPQDFLSYFGEMFNIKGTDLSKKAENIYKKNNTASLYEKIANWPGIRATTNKAMNAVKELIDRGVSDEELNEAIENVRWSMATSFSGIQVGLSQLGPGMGLVLANMAVAPIEYARSETPPEAGGLNVGQQNLMHRLIRENSDKYEIIRDENGLIKTDSRIDPKLWKDMQDVTLKYYDHGVYTDIGLPKFEKIETAEKFVLAQNSRLFGVTGKKGEITVGENGEFPGEISQHVIIDPSTGEPSKIEDLDLRTNEKIPVQYKGKLSVINPYGPDAMMVHIDGKEYVVLGQNASRDEIIVNNLNSFQFSHDNVGMPFDTGFKTRPENGAENITATPMYNEETERFEVRFSNGDIYSSDKSIEDAYKLFLKSE